MSNAITFRMAAGIPGALTRGTGQDVVVPEAGSSTYPFLAYGVFGKFNGNNFVPLVANDTAPQIVGVLVRPFPTNSGQSGLGVSVPPTSGMLDRLAKGYISVLLGYGTAVKGGQVYVRTVAAGGFAVGSIEDGTNGAGGTTVAVPGAFFTGAADANGNVEITYVAPGA